MKWDIDRQMLAYEPLGVPGTVWQRTLVEVSLLRTYSLHISKDARDNESRIVWSLGIGSLQEPKWVFIYGFTMRECFLRLRMLVKTKKLKLDPKLFPKLFKKSKPKEKKRKKLARKKSDT
jgi:hypothetical protein